MGMRMPAGQIVSLVLEKRFGFIQPAGGGDDIFFHNSVVNCPIETLKVGQEVTYEIDSTAEKARAKSVMVPGRSPSPHGHESTDQQGARQPRSQTKVSTEFGFVTKLLWKKRRGFISADSGGAELLFEDSDVSGDKRFQQLKVGDSVRFVRNPYSGDNPIQNPATVTAVQVIERVPKKLPTLELPNNPKARRKKPTWR